MEKTKKNTKFKRRSMLVICLILMITITISSYAAWEGGRADDARNFNLGLGELSRVDLGFAAGTGVRVSGERYTGTPIGPVNITEAPVGDIGFDLFPFTQTARMGDRGVNFMRVVVNIEITADETTEFDMNYAVRFVVTGDPLVGAESGFYIAYEEGSTAMPALPGADVEARRDALKAIIADNDDDSIFAIGIGGTGEQVLTGNVPAADIIVGTITRQYTFFFFLDSTDMEDMAGEFSFNVIVENTDLV